MEVTQKIKYQREMITEYISVIKNSKRLYSAYEDNLLIGSIADNFYRSIQGFKINSFSEIIIDQSKYILKCIENYTPLENARYAAFELLTIGNKKVGNIEVLFYSFFSPLTKNNYIIRPNRIDTLTCIYKHGSFIWSDKNAAVVLTYKNGTIKYDDSILLQKDEVNLLIMISLVIKESILKRLNTRRTLVTIIPVILVLIAAVYFITYVTY